MVITTTGARLIRKSLKSRWVAEPIITFGGLPIIRAVPPTLHMRISETRTGTGEIFSIRQREMVIGAIRRAAVTESMREAPTAVTQDRSTRSSLGDPLDLFIAHRASTRKKPDFFTTEIRIIMPARRPRVFQSIYFPKASDWVTYPA